MSGGCADSQAGQLVWCAFAITELISCGIETRVLARCEIARFEGFDAGARESDEDAVCLYLGWFEDLVRIATEVDAYDEGTTLVLWSAEGSGHPSVCIGAHKATIEYRLGTLVGNARLEQVPQ
jgi:hypothetical protein